MKAEKFLTRNSSSAFSNGLLLNDFRGSKYEHQKHHWIPEAWMVSEICRKFSKWSSQLLRSNHLQSAKFSHAEHQVFEQKPDYIHHNSVVEKWKLVKKPEDYYYSNARYYLLNEISFDFITHYMEHLWSGRWKHRTQVESRLLKDENMFSFFLHPLFFPVGRKNTTC